MAKAKVKMPEMKQALTDRRAQLETELGQLSNELRELGIDQGLEQGAAGNHLADDGSLVFEAERIGTVSDDLRDVLNQVNSALERMDEGTYGTCQRCNRPINRDRLEAFPYVAYCIECQTTLERENALLNGR